MTSIMEADRAALSDSALNQVNAFLAQLGPWRQIRPDRAEGLERASAFFALLGNPQDAVRTVHVAGTAGKGSVVAFIASILRAHGFRVGAHSSPHVYSLAERFQIDGAPVSPELLLRALAAVRPAAEHMSESRYGAPSFFEATNAIAFHAFADQVDYSVIEAGIGGLYDSTNTISRGDKLAVITPIGLDHTDILGSTLAQIAAQKAGILPVGGRAVIARPQVNEVAAALRAEQVRRGCAVELVDVATAVADAVTTGGGTTLRLPDQSRWPLGLVGRHQAGNAHLALRAVAELAAWDGWALDERATAHGLRSVRLPGRFERRTLPDGRPVILDGAHNPIKLAALVATLHELHPGARFPWVVAFKQDKDVAAALQIIAPAASSIVATEFHAAAGDHPAGVSVAPERVAAAAARSGITITVEADPIKAVSLGRCRTRPSGGGQRFLPPAGRDRPDSIGSTAVTPPDDGNARERVWGRFDDLRSGTALACHTPDRILVANRVQDVADVLDQVQRATDAGRWAFGYVAYEAAAGLDPDLAVHPHPEGGMPLAWFGICDEPVPVPAVSDTQQAGPYRADWYPAWTPAGHADQVGRIRDHIAAGDTFQCNLTVRMNGRVSGDTRALYRDLVLRQRGAHNAYLDMGRFVIASASPELFFERRGDRILLRPMKGTSRRGRHPDEDRRLAAELRSSPKERAENIMIVDLMRNDIGRVALTGTVRVRKLLTVERYETVLQMTSAVTAQLRPGVGLTDLFRVLFPCGSSQVPRKPVPCRSSGPSNPNPAVSTAAPSGSSAHPARPSGPGSTWPSEQPLWTPTPATPSTASAAASPGSHRHRPNTPRCSPKQPCCGPVIVTSNCWAGWPTDRAAASAIPIPDLDLDLVECPGLRPLAGYGRRTINTRPTG